mgnify:CR=1 FL=1
MADGDVQRRAEADAGRTQYHHIDGTKAVEAVTSELVKLLG